MKKYWMRKCQAPPFLKAPPFLVLPPLLSKIFQPPCLQPTQILVSPPLLKGGGRNYENLDFGPPTLVGLGLIRSPMLVH